MRALSENTRAPWQLLIVDNASTDGSLERFGASGVAARIVRNDKNLGFAAGVNAALALVDTPFALLLNPDAFVHPGCLDALLERAISTSKAAAVGAGLRNPDGSLQPASRNAPSPLTHFIEAFRLYRVLRYLPGVGRWYLLLSKQDAPRRVDWVVGACMLVRLAAVSEVGPFDDRYFMYAEELDWCVRARRAGWEIWFEPAAVATHTLGGSSQQNELPMMVESYRSMYRFYETYYPHSWATAARVITRAAMLVRAISLPFRRRRSRARLAAYREIARL